MQQGAFHNCDESIMLRPRSGLWWLCSSESHPGGENNSVVRSHKAATFGRVPDEAGVIQVAEDLGEFEAPRFVVVLLVKARAPRGVLESLVPEVCINIQMGGCDLEREPTAGLVAGGPGVIIEIK